MVDSQIQIFLWFFGHFQHESHNLYCWDTIGYKSQPDSGLQRPKPSVVFLLPNRSTQLEISRRSSLQCITDASCNHLKIWRNQQQFLLDGQPGSLQKICLKKHLFFDGIIFVRLQAQFFLHLFFLRHTTTTRNECFWRRGKWLDSDSDSPQLSSKSSQF